MAQVARYGEVDLDSLFSQAKEQEKNGLGKKMSGAFVPAEQLNYVPREGWRITPTRAELIGSNRPQVDGKYPIEKLEIFSYDVSFAVELKDNFHSERPISVITTLTLPDGTTQKNEYKVMEYPRNKPFLLKAGEFINRFDRGDIIFNLEIPFHKTWFEGFVIYGVGIGQPIIMPVPK